MFGKVEVLHMTEERNWADVKWKKAQSPTVSENPGTSLRTAAASGPARSVNLPGDGYLERRGNSALPPWRTRWTDDHNHNRLHPEEIFKNLANDVQKGVDEEPHRQYKTQFISALTKALEAGALQAEQMR